jgi:hypothetical protein
MKKRFYRGDWLTHTIVSFLVPTVLMVAILFVASVILITHGELGVQ